MIRFEYDVPTSGVRVSFVIRDSGHFPDLTTLFTDLKHGNKNSTTTCPDTPDNLEAIKQLVDYEKGNS
jgi:hypothetical protein